MEPSGRTLPRLTLPPLTRDGASRPALYAAILWRHRRLIALQTLAVALVTAVVALLLPSWYRARAVLLPPVAQEGGLSLSAMLADIKVPGVQVPTAASQTDVHLAVLRSRWVGERLVRQFDLLRRYDVKTMDDAVAVLAKHTTAATTDQGTIVVTVEDKDRARSAAMANAYVDLLDEFNRENRMTRGKAARLFVERRLRETGDSLRLAEDELTAYQRLHRGVALGADAAGAAQAAATVMAQRMTLAVKLEALRASLSPSNPDVLQAQNELAALDRQLGAMPTVGREMARLYRRVKVEEQLYTLLTAQYEEARVTEARDTPTVDVLDRATPPSRRARPQRRAIVLTAAALGLAWSVLLAFGLEALRSTRRAA